MILANYLKNWQNLLLNKSLKYRILRYFFIANLIPFNKGGGFMKKIMTLIVCFMIIIMIFPNLIIPVSALTIKNPNFELNVKSAVLMDAETGTVLYSKNHKEALPPASVTKIMTLLLVFERIEEGNLNFDDELTASEYASSMGGSQVFLKAGEKNYRRRTCEVRNHRLGK